jgi:hypothetical protein
MNVVGSGRRKIKKKRKKRIMTATIEQLPPDPFLQYTDIMLCVNCKQYLPSNDDYFIGRCKQRMKLCYNINQDKKGQLVKMYEEVLGGDMCSMFVLFDPSKHEERKNGVEHKVMMQEGDG